MYGARRFDVFRGKHRKRANGSVRHKATHKAGYKIRAGQCALPRRHAAAAGRAADRTANACAAACVCPMPRPDKPVATSPALLDLEARLSEQPLTINDAVAIALATNPQLALSTTALYRAQGRTSEARAALNPNAGRFRRPDVSCQFAAAGWNRCGCAPVRYFGRAAGGDQSGAVSGSGDAAGHQPGAQPDRVQRERARFTAFCAPKLW